MSEPVEIKLVTTTRKGTKLLVPATIAYEGNRIAFLKSPFALKDEIKAMQGARWHGYEDPSRKIWSVANSPRNQFTLEYMKGGNPYAMFDQPLRNYDYDRPLYGFQKLMSDKMLTYHYQIIAAEMGAGKTLSAIECMEQSGVKNWWWVAPKSGIRAVEREFDKWGLTGVDVLLMTYEALRSKMKNWTDGDCPPQGVFFDESSRLKNAMAQRTQAAQALADGIRETYGNDGYVLLMSGTPSSKTPINWWSQGEIAYPGFLREGDTKSFERRLGIYTEKEAPHGKFYQRVSWLDDSNKCAVCGEFADHMVHQEVLCDSEYHQFQESINEVAYLHERLQGLATVLHMKDCVDLPDKIYRTIKCECTPTVTRVASALAKAAPNIITGLTWLRELSDGFQYRDVEDGTEHCPVCTDGKTGIWVDPLDEDRTFTMIDMLESEYVETLEKRTVDCPTCDGTAQVPHMVRVTKEVPCPKEDAIKELLEENEETGRLVVFAGFTASIDRITKTCQQAGWDVVRVDGRGWDVYSYLGDRIKDEKPLNYWADTESHPRVCFVAHPLSGGMALTLTESRMSVFYSNDFSTEGRIQAEARIHRIGMDMNKGCTIVDLVHLPTDERVIKVLKANRRLELMTLGELQEAYDEA